MRRFILSLLFIGSVLFTPLFGQLEVFVRIDSAIISTACDDLFSDPDPTYQVSVGGEAFVNYDFGANPCFLQAPSIQYTQPVIGACNLPPTVEVCFRVFDNDGDIIPCLVIPECLEESCVDLPLPVAGLENQETIDVLGSTDGTLYLSVGVAIDSTDFNYICGAEDLGSLDYGQTIGDATAGIYDNTCADNFNEINPATQGTNLPNNHGVWFTYTTGAAISSLHYVRLFSDPDNTGDPIDLELMVYTADDDCGSNLTRYPLFFTRQDGDNASIDLYCPQPNTTYYILVDGRGNTDATQQGVFSIEVEDTGLPEGGDLRCEATDIGTVPENGSASLPSPQGNFCAGFSDDPPNIPAFNSRNSVWVKFFAPSSGHVEIAGTSVAPLGIDLEFALFQSSNDDCTGSFELLFSGIDPNTYDLSFNMTCLDPGRPYWILIDGTFFQSIGYFDITVTDLGDIRPVSMRSDTVCAGDTLFLTNDIFYDQTGEYTDTVKIGATNCDSIIITDLTVLPPVEISFVQTAPAIGPAGTDGDGMVSAVGGTGDFIFSWCDGSVGSNNNMLVAGTLCCVTATDTKGCVADTCFTVDFVEPLTISTDSVAVLCNGDSNGAFSFSGLGDRADYIYSYTNDDGSITGTDTFSVEGELITISNVPAGNYTIDFEGQFFDTAFIIEVTEPPLLTIAIDQFAEISCYQACDGMVSAAALGGFGALDVVLTSAPNQGVGCAGTYVFTVTDENGCTATTSAVLVEPTEFIGQVAAVTEVSCFGGNDGSISVTTNGSPIAYNWSNGGTTATVSGLGAGSYTVTITNADGCPDTLNQFVTEPAVPITAEIQQIQQVTCFDSQDGGLTVVVNGNNGNVNYDWSNGTTTPSNTNLGPGMYSVDIIDANGCTVTADFNLTAPPALAATTLVRDLTCPDPLDAGAISIPEVSGGEGPYLYSLNGDNFGVDTLFVGLEQGLYEITIQDALGCELEVPSIVEPAPVLVADLGADRQILLGDSIPLSVIANSNNLVYNWSDDPLFGAGQRFIRPVDNQTFTVSVFDTVTLCNAMASVTILVDRKPRVYVPTAFSPNGDGINDVFFPYGGTDVQAISDFRIFGRFGNLVFEQSEAFSANDPAIGWDGTIRGKTAQIGVYVYSARVTFFDGREEIVKGEITLLR